MTHARIVFTVNAAGLQRGATYGLQGSWHDTAGAGTDFGVSPEHADASGHVSFQLNPIVLASIAHRVGPGTLTLDVTDHDGNPLGGGYHLTQAIV